MRVFAPGPYEARAVISCATLSIGLILTPPVSSYAQDAELNELRQQLELMKRQDEARRRAMQALEERVRQLERARPGVATTPAAPPPPARPAPSDVETRTTSAEEPRRAPAPTPAIEDIVTEGHTYFGSRLTLEPSINYARFDRAAINLSGFLALDAIFLGTISIDQVSSDIVTADLTGRYGITDRLQIDVNMPYVYRSSNFQSGGVGGASTALAEETVSSGPRIGDVSAGIYYRILPETGSLPDLVWSVRGKAPTGSHPFGVRVVDVPGTEGNLRVPERLPTGNGVWSLSTGLSVLKTFDPIVLFGNVNYFHNFQKGFDDIDSTSGEQPGDVKLGDAYQFGFGMALALNERTSLSLGYTQRFVEQSRTRVADQGFRNVIGSDATVGTLNFGLTFAVTENFSIITNVAAGLTTDAPDVQLGLRTPYRF